MNKAIKAAMVAVLFFAGTSLADQLVWEFTGLASNNQVEYCGGSCGYWFTYGDENEAGGDGLGGCTKTNFPTSDDPEEDISSAWGALGGVITFTHIAGGTNDNGGTCTYEYPFAGIAFNWRKPIEPVNIANEWLGLKVYYEITGEGEFSMEFASCDPDIMDADGCHGSLAGNNEYKVDLAKGKFTDADMGKEYFFDTFVRWPGWGGEAPLLKDIPAASVKFKWAAGNGTAEDKTATLFVKEVWLIGDGTPIINAGTAKSQVQMNLAGKTLFFGGITSNAIVEVIDLQGALVAKGTVGPKGNSINLSRLNNGVYIIRVKGEKLNLTQKVVIK
jgi:hypothetical protein